MRTRMWKPIASTRSIQRGLRLATLSAPIRFFQHMSTGASRASENTLRALRAKRSWIVGCVKSRRRRTGLEGSEISLAAATRATGGHEES